jgi:rhodanese-related sulfurtransferase
MMKKFLFLSSFFLSNLLNGQAPSYEKMLSSLLKKSVVPIDVKEAKTKKSAYFIDTRVKREFDVSHIKNAQWVGYNEFNLEKVRNIPKDSEVIVYCSVGYRSEKIGEKLEKAGYKNVKNLWGGIFEWVNDGNLVVDNTEKTTQKVHAYSQKWGTWLLKGEKIYE